MRDLRSSNTVRLGLLLVLVSGPCCIYDDLGGLSSDGGDGDATSHGGATTQDPPTSAAGTSADTGEPVTTTGDDPNPTGDPSGSGSTGETEDPEPPLPAGLVVYVTGNPEDADVDPTGPGLVLMGGGPDVDEAFTWWGDYIAGGDVVVLRTSGSDGYNDYLYGFGNADSVETIILSAAFADDPYVSWKLRHAEAIWIAGGDQAEYLTAWKDTDVEQGIAQAWDRGAVVGGTSAGLAVLGELIYAAYNDTVYSYEALEDPYNVYMTMERGFLSLPPLAGIITDTHFYERDRMGRLVAFLARIQADGWATSVSGLGVDEATAVVVGPDGAGTVIGAGHVYVVHADHPPQTCTAGVALDYDGLEYYTLAAGDALTLPGAVVAGAGDALAAAGGVTIPANPY